MCTDRHLSFIAKSWYNERTTRERGPSFWETEMLQNLEDAGGWYLFPSSQQEHARGRHTCTDCGQSNLMYLLSPQQSTSGRP